MKKLYFLGALVASTLLVACVDEPDLEGIDLADSDPTETLGEVSSALAAGCTHTAFVHKPGEVQGQGAVACTSAKSEINVNVMLRRNGTNVRFAESRCFNSSSCFARANHPDSAGTQQWCAFTMAGTPLYESPGKTHCRDF